MGFQFRQQFMDGMDFLVLEDIAEEGKSQGFLHFSFFLSGKDKKFS